MTDFRRAPVIPVKAPESLFLRGLGIQCRVIGAVLMRELHTRYGRENIGYLWLVGEPLLLGTVIGLIHLAQPWHKDRLDPVTLAVVGYTVFIMFRGIISRSEGTLHGNLPLLYHRMVTVLDIVVARALLEAAGTFLSFLILLSLLIVLGYTSFPARPLMVMVAIGYVFWISVSMSLIVVGGTYENSILERFIHPFTYFMMPLSGAFFQVSILPREMRSIFMLNPFPHAFEILRYGIFEDGTLEYVNFTYLTIVCMFLSVWGLVLVRTVHHRIHLS